MSTKTKMHVPYVYLTQEFDPDKPLGKRILSAIAEEMRYGRYTLGPAVQEFEERFAEVCQVKHAIGVGSGTDALFLIMKALDIGPGKKVVTVPNTFVATVGAILATGALAQFLDIGDDYLLSYYPNDGRLLIPVHWGGNVSIPHSNFMIEDACQAIGGSINGKYMVGNLAGRAAAFSLHPLKNVNIIGDGGMVTTNSDTLAREIRRLQNHGLVNRDICIKPGYNSRLDTIQAIVGLEVLKELKWVTDKRIANAKRYDQGLCTIPEVAIPPRNANIKHVYHLYQVEVADKRDELIDFLSERGVEAKVHYPIPLHLQPAFGFLGYKKGNFPRAEYFADHHITLPIHQYLTEEQIDYTIETIAGFYRGRT